MFLNFDLKIRFCQQEFENKIIHCLLNIRRSLIYQYKHLQKSKRTFYTKLYKKIYFFQKLLNITVNERFTLEFQNVLTIYFY